MKTLAWMGFGFASVVLVYVGWSNYVIMDLENRGAELLYPKNFMMESLILILIGLSIGVPSLIMINKK